MKKINLFICHRPYHVLRSADLVYKYFQSKDFNNIVIVFNLININAKSYQSPIPFYEMEEVFDKVITINRNDDVSIWHPIAFKKYYNKKVLEFREFVDTFDYVQKVYFFSDMEKPIEILVGLFAEKNRKLETIIVDEGMATYFRKRKSYLKYLKSAMVQLFNYKYINKSVFYGDSHLYNKALAALPEKSYFHGKVCKLEPLSPPFIQSVLCYKQMNFAINIPYILYLSSLVDISFNVAQTTELEIVGQLKKLAERHGYKFYIKAHPLQDINYYSLYSENVIETKIPAEVFMNDNSVITSCGSSSLLNAYFQGIKTVDLANIFGVKCVYKKVVDLFAPTSVSEISKIL